MVERIERISRVKAVEYDVNRPYDRGEGGNGGTSKRFAQVLRDTMSHRGSSSPGSTVPEAYRLELSVRPTQSLFYQDSPNLHILRSHANGAG